MRLKEIITSKYTADCVQVWYHDFIFDVHSSVLGHCAGCIRIYMMGSHSNEC